MRIRERESMPEAEGDMTPMIDMTFQLIAFFMVLINFSDAEQDKRVRLPESELAKPPEERYEEQKTIQLTKDDLILFGGDEMSSLDKLHLALKDAKTLVEIGGKKKAEDVTVVIRADRNAKHGRVQDIIQKCQDVGFIKFALRGKQGRVVKVPAEGS